MRINIDSILKVKPEPNSELLEPFIERARLLLIPEGLGETQLIRDAAIPFGRILFDLRDSLVSVRSMNGKPEIFSEYAEARRGIRFLGKYGVGKTLSMQAMAKELGGEYFAIPELEEGFAKRGVEWFFNAVDKAGRWDLFLDDLGTEIGLTHFGKPFPVANLLYKRYNLWQSYGVRTHISTNLIESELAKFYNERIVDRLGEMTRPVKSVEKSLRKKQG
jgi:hypothetical protein